MLLYVFLRLRLGRAGMGLFCTRLFLAACIAPFLAPMAHASACTELPAGSRFLIRLTSQVSSYNAKPGMPVHGFVLDSPECDQQPVLAMKVPVEGRVVSAHRVGLGLWHETARLELEFNQILPPDGDPIDIHARVVMIENAREEVKKGVIRGIRATDTPQGTISSSLRHLPSLRLYPDPFLLGYKMVFPIFPEPEICLEPGADMELELTQAAALPPDLPAPSAVPVMDDEPQIAGDLTNLSERTYTKKGKEADVVNIVFAGSRDELAQAFAIAGWSQAESIWPHGGRGQIHAFLDKISYARAPMSTQLLDGNKPDMMLERSFDSYEKRDHLRVWALPPSHTGEELWASAAVRETGATLSIRHKGFFHHVSPELLEEQHVVVRDLLAADCVASVGSIARPDMDHVFLNATGEIFRTDGTLTVIRLKPCGTDAEGAGFSDAPHFRPGSKPYRYMRKEILTVRSDLWRANIIYSMFNLTRITVSALRRSSMHHADVMAFRQSNHTTSSKTILLPYQPKPEVAHNQLPPASE
jgi:hypothetical protein